MGSDFIPKIVVILPVIVVFGLTLSELGAWAQLRIIGEDFFGERMWRLVESPLTQLGAGFLASAVAFLLSEKWSPGYITGLVMLGVSWMFFSLAIHRTRFFASKPYERTKKVISFGMIAIVLGILFTRLPSKAVPSRIVEVKAPESPHDIPPTPVAPPPRSYLVFDGQPFRFGEKRDLLGQLLPDQNFQVGEQLFFNCYSKVAGPNPIIGVSGARWLYIEPDVSPATQARMIADFKNNRDEERRKHSVKVITKVLMPTDPAGFDSIVATTEDRKKPLILTKPDIDALRLGTKIIFAIVELGYTDNGQLHHLRKCQFLQPPAAAPGIWHDCEDFINPD